MVFLFKSMCVTEYFCIFWGCDRYLLRMMSCFIRCLHFFPSNNFLTLWSMFIQHFSRSLSVSTRFSIEKKNIDQFSVFFWFAYVVVQNRLYKSVSKTEQRVRGATKDRKKKPSTKVINNF